MPPSYMRKPKWAVVGLALLTFLALPPAPASGFLVTGPQGLEDLAKAADLVVKAKVVSDVAVTDPWFNPVLGFEAREAELSIISVVKGSPPAKVVRFRHYASIANSPVMYHPSYSDLQPGRAYVVFASDAGGGGYRQLTKNPSEKIGEGVELAGDARPHRGKTVTEAVRAELVTLLASPVPADVEHAIHELDERSGGHRSHLSDFPRRPALELVRPLLLATVPVAQVAALAMFGASSPYAVAGDAPYFLTSLPKAHIGGLTPRPIVTNDDAEVGAKELVAIADGKLPGAARATAILALGRAPTPRGVEAARWFGDADPLVRRAAVLLASDSRDATTILAASRDGSDAVREGAALAVAFAQDPKLLPVLDGLMKDPSPKVIAAAALGLLSFPVDDAGPVMHAHIASDYGSLFVNALAASAPGAYLAELGDVIARDPRPAAWWGGTIPSFDSWRLLFGHVKTLSAPELRSGKLAGPLDALESLHWGGSSEPRALYALYVKRGMKTRAQRFRDACKKTVPFDMTTYFDEADKDPTPYFW